ncbi:MAG: nucleotidyltransferase domain-containing protein [Candidatus Bathyarchaeia archaeon]
MDKLKVIKNYQLEKIILFGSYVTGEVDELSDIDLVIIKDTNKKFIERLIEVAKNNFNACFYSDACFMAE